MTADTLTQSNESESVMDAQLYNCCNFVLCVFSRVVFHAHGWADAALTAAS